jgi:ATP-dependent Clp protease ATP-binding subunit ClpA
MHYTEEARRFLLARGTSARYGARELKRTIERHVVLPLSNLVATKQIKEGDILLADLAKDEGDLVFMKRHIQAIAPSPYDFSFDRIGSAPAMAGVAR